MCYAPGLMRSLSPVGGRGPHPEAAAGESFLLEVDGVPFGVALLS